MPQALVMALSNHVMFKCRSSPPAQRTQICNASLQLNTSVLPEKSMGQTFPPSRKYLRLSHVPSHHSSTPKQKLRAGSSAPTPLFRCGDAAQGLWGAGEAVLRGARAPAAPPAVGTGGSSGPGTDPQGAGDASRSCRPAARVPVSRRRDLPGVWLCHGHGIDLLAVDTRHTEWLFCASCLGGIALAFPPAFPAPESRRATCITRYLL